MKYHLSVLLAMFAVFSAVPFATPETAAKEVRMTDNLTYEPKTITIRSGETVIWKNASSMLHSVTDVPGKAAKAQDAVLPRNAKEFDSGLLEAGKTFSHTFTVPGTYKYFCIPHEELGMVGTVIVKK